MSALPFRTCRDCPAQITRPHAVYCDTCRWRHRGKRVKWELTAEREELLRKRYREVGPRRLGRMIGVPRHAVSDWARRLGLQEPRSAARAWTATEDRFLEDHLGTRHVSWIARKLSRTVNSVAVRAKRLHLSRVLRDGYTLRDLCTGFGVDHRVVDAWRSSGKLRVRHRHGGARPAFERDPWFVAEREVIRFIRENRDAYRLARVDQDWFLGLVLPAPLRLADRNGGVA